MWRVMGFAVAVLTAAGAAMFAGSLAVIALDRRRMAYRGRHRDVW